jgi:hypothetical protein
MGHGARKLVLLAPRWLADLQRRDRDMAQRF